MKHLNEIDVNLSKKQLCYLKAVDHQPGQGDGHKASHAEQKKRRFHCERAIAPIVQTTKTVVDFIVIISFQVQFFYVVFHIDGYFGLGGRSTSFERVRRYVRP